MSRWILRLAVVFIAAVALSLPAAAQKQEITVLVWSHFIPDVDKVLKKHAEEFSSPPRRRPRPRPNPVTTSS